MIEEVPRITNVKVCPNQRYANQFLIELDFPYWLPYFTRMKATVTSKGQITIPLGIRRKLKLHTGTVLEFDEHADYLKASKSIDLKRMRSVIGIAKSELGSKSTLQWLEDLRGPVELPRQSRE